MKEIKPFSERMKPIYFLSLEQIQQQLKSLEPADIEKIRESSDLGKKYIFGLREAVATLIYAGLRREELLMLTHSDVVLDRGKDSSGGMILIRSKQVSGIEW